MAVQSALITLEKAGHIERGFGIPDRAVKRTGGKAATVRQTMLSHERLNAHNTFDAPEVVRPAPFGGATVQGGQLSVMLPAKSVVVLELQ